MTARQDRMAALMALTPELEAEGWRSLAFAPHDGTEIELRLVHAYAPFCKDPVAEGYIATATARWIDHNGGGWTWEGLCGRPAQWRPLPAGADISAAEMVRIARRARAAA
jgi:hypothetical protein